MTIINTKQENDSAALRLHFDKLHQDHIAKLLLRYTCLQTLWPESLDIY